MIFHKKNGIVIIDFMSKRIVVAVGMSGGVDSSAAAYLLQKQGCEVIGISMRLWQDGLKTTSACSSPEKASDLLDAQRVCEHLGIPHHVCDVSSQFADSVIVNFRSEYRAGRTPNPCVLCNPLIKFGALWEQARDSGIHFDLFATGHYARAALNPSSGRYELLRASDHSKDQSYFLYRLTQSQLARTLFPLGGMSKNQTQQIVREAGLEIIAEKPESQDFAGAAARQFSLPAEERLPGRIIDEHGRLLGEHSDIGMFTLGQRKGLRIGGLKEPLYVVAIDPISGDVTVGPKTHLAVKSLTAGMLNWIAFEELTVPLERTARCRSSQEGVACLIKPLSATKICVEFDKPHFSATPGQSIVFDQLGKVLGGGIIFQTNKS